MQTEGQNHKNPDTGGIIEKNNIDYAKRNLQSLYLTLTELDKTEGWRLSDVIKDVATDQRFFSWNIDPEISRKMEKALKRIRELTQTIGIAPGSPQYGQKGIMQNIMKAGNLAQ